MEKNLQNIYKKLFDIQTFTNNESSSTPNIILNGMVSVVSNLILNGNSYFNLDLLFNQNVNIINDTINTINTNNLSATSLVIDGFHISDDLICNQDLTCNNMYVNTTMNISTDSLINNNLTISSNLYISGISILNNIYTKTISSNSILNINSDHINIGNIDSIITINGTTLNISTTDIKIQNKTISLNFNSDLSKIDSGNLSGFEIRTINNNNGFIRTDINNTYFEIKLPSDNNIKRIVELDPNNNINISGYSIFNNNVTIYNSLYVSQNLSVNNINVNNDLYISGTATINNIYVSNLTLLGNSIINNNLFVTDLYITNTCYLNNNTTIMSSLNCNSVLLNNLIVAGDVLSNNLLINDNVTIKSNLTTNNLNLLGNLNVNNYTILNTALFTNNATTTNLYVNNDCTINNATILSKFIVNNNMTVDNNITIKSNLYSNYNIIMPLKEYDNSKIAALNGVPLGGLFRTGDVVKIRIDVVAPVISLIGATSITVIQNFIYNELGINMVDDTQAILQPYIVSIKSNNIELLTNAIQISNNLNIPQIDTSIVRILNLTYMVADNFNNITTIPRQINITIAQAILVPFSDASIAKTFGYTRDFISSSPIPSITIVDNTMVQVGGASMWGFKGSAMPQSNFIYNFTGTWSVMFKFKLTTGTVGGTATVADMHYDNSTTGWGLPGRCNQGSDTGGDLFSIRDGGTGSNSGYQAIFDPLVLTELLSGIYVTITRAVSGRVGLVVHNLAGIKRIQINGYNPYTYTNNQTMFSVYLEPQKDKFTFYNGILTSTLVGLTPAHWNLYVT